LRRLQKKPPFVEVGRKVEKGTILRGYPLLGCSLGIRIWSAGGEEKEGEKNSPRNMVHSF